LKSNNEKSGSVYFGIVSRRRRPDKPKTHLKKWQHLTGITGRVSSEWVAGFGSEYPNVVYFELFRRGGKVYVGKYNDKEIDFIVQKSNNEREYYQVAFTVNDEKTFKREISAFKRINDNYPKYLLTLDYDNANIDGIQKLNVIDWLLQ